MVQQTTNGNLSKYLNGGPVGILPDQNMFDVSSGQQGVLDARESFVGIVNDIFSRQAFTIENPNGVDALVYETPITQAAAWIQPAGTNHIEPVPPSTTWNYHVYSIEERNSLLANSAFIDAIRVETQRVLVDCLVDTTPQWTVWDASAPAAGETAPTDDDIASDPSSVFTLAKQYDVAVESFADRNLLPQGLTPISTGDRVLVAGSPESSGFWSIWKYDPLSLSADEDGFTLDQQQTARTVDFWSYTDWYAEGYSAAEPPVVRYATPADRDRAENPNPKTTFVRIDNSGDGTWIWTAYADGTWTVVARQNGTIKLSEKFYDPDLKLLENPTADLALIPYRDGSWEFRAIYDELQSGSVLTNLEINEVFFSMLHFVHAQQDQVPWAFKTSFMTIGGYNEALLPVPVQPIDNTQNLLDYIDEVKPYRVKTRDFTRIVSPPVDVANTTVTDFDFPMYYDPKTAQNRYLSLDNADDLAIIANTAPWKYWYENYEKTGTDPTVPSTFNPVRRMNIKMMFDRIDHMPVMDDQDFFYRKSTITDLELSSNAIGNFIEVYIDGEQTNEFTVDGLQTANTITTSEFSLGIWSGSFNSPVVEDPSYQVTVTDQGQPVKVFRSKPHESFHVTNQEEFTPVIGQTYRIDFTLRKIANATSLTTDYPAAYANAGLTTPPIVIPAYVRPSFDAEDANGVVDGYGLKYGEGYESADLFNTTNWELNKWYTLSAIWTPASPYVHARGRIRVNRTYFGPSYPNNINDIYFNSTPGATGPVSDAQFEIKEPTVTTVSQTAGGQHVYVTPPNHDALIHVVIRDSLNPQHIIETTSVNFQTSLPQVFTLDTDPAGYLIDVKANGTSLVTADFEVADDKLTVTRPLYGDTDVFVTLRNDLTEGAEADRIRQFYDPQGANAEKNLRRLMGLEFKANVLDGGELLDNSWRDYDVDGNATGNATASVQDEEYLNSNGNALSYADAVYGANRPQELMVVGSGEQLAMTIDAAWSSGVPAQRSFQSDVSNAVGSSYAINIKECQAHDGVHVFVDGLRVPAASYTVDWVNSIVNVDAVSGAEHVEIRTFGMSSYTKITSVKEYHKEAGDISVTLEVVPTSQELIVVYIDGQSYDDAVFDGTDQLTITQLFGKPDGYPVTVTIQQLPYPGAPQDTQVYLQELTYSGPVALTNPTTPATDETNCTFVDMNGKRLIPNTDYTVSAGTLTITAPITGLVQVMTFTNADRLNILNTYFDANPEGQYDIHSPYGSNYTWITMNGEYIPVNGLAIGTSADKVMVTSFQASPAFGAKTWHVSMNMPSRDLITPFETGDYDARPLEVLSLDYGPIGGSEVVGNSSVYVGNDVPNPGAVPNAYAGETKPIYVFRREAWEFVQWNKNADGVLANSVTSTDTEIHLSNTSVISNVTLMAEQYISNTITNAVSIREYVSEPGVIWINGERIEFFKMEETSNAIVLTELKRGTHNTRIGSEQLTKATRSGDGTSKVFTLPEFTSSAGIQITVNEVPYNSNGIQIITDDYTGYPINVPKTFGIDYTVASSGSGVTITFTKAPAAGSTIYILQQSGIVHSSGSLVYDGKNKLGYNPDQRLI
jgi:hypothetical protein